MRRTFRPSAALMVASLASAPCLAAAGTPSTAEGRISVAQVAAMLDEAPRNPTARQVLTAYLAGLGEATGALVQAARPRERTSGLCRTALGIDDGAARRVLAAVDRERRAETPATPLLVADMLARAGCRLPE
ncbi:chlorophyllide reductase [Methylobacterium oryzisoli]|uniref:chlorophyllide reductase n=1 Tax=Methylobacterium oryzisoli TaxID=3385502 RepID=UPI0038928127